ncbi:MAG TPA: heme ABC exporter ATP-binding protein CcmA [Stellaceae bacterium]|nr:heme ABC exporter ATP-binding protein CcmA [Stellaceae bacterium]
MLPTPGAPALAGQGLACRRGERLVFTGLDFAVQPGGALLLTGANGTGKTSLLRLMAGLAPPAAGAIFRDGKPAAEDAAAHRARLRYVGHQDALKPVLSARENLAFWARLQGGDGTHVDAALARFRLASRADWPCRHLSAGERKRLALARLEAAPARLWLLDEPTSHLDESAQDDLLALIAEHRSGGGSVVIATHVALPIPGPARLSLAEFAPGRAA